MWVSSVYNLFFIGLFPVIRGQSSFILQFLHPTNFDIAGIITNYISKKVQKLVTLPSSAGEF